MAEIKIPDYWTPEQPTAVLEFKSAFPIKPASSTKLTDKFYKSCRIPFIARSK